MHIVIKPGDSFTTTWWPKPIYDPRTLFPDLRLSFAKDKFPIFPSNSCDSSTFLNLHFSVYSALFSTTSDVLVYGAIVLDSTWNKHFHFHCNNNKPILILSALCFFGVNQHVQFLVSTSQLTNQLNFDFNGVYHASHFPQTSYFPTISPNDSFTWPQELIV